MQMKKYKAFGLVLGSELEMEELPLSDQEIDVKIVFNEVNEHVETEPKIYGYCDVKPNKVILIIPNVAKFRMTDGQLIEVDAADHVDPLTLKLFLLGSCMGAILIQRGSIPIHGSALYYKDRGILVVGDSGAGKSTLASALVNRGAQLLSDDVIPMIIKDGIYYAVPSVPLQKLAQESMSERDLSNFVNREVPYSDKNRKKYYVDRNNVFYDNFMKIDNVVNIVLSDLDHVNICNISGSEKMKILLNNIYRFEFVNGLKKQKECFEVCSGISTQSQVYILKRPRQGITVDEQIGNIEEVISLV